MAWYDAGTVKVTVNSATVTGTGTKWLAGARQGEAFVAPDGRLYEVLNIASDTSLTLTKPYRGATATGQPYALAPMQGYVKELADRAAELLPALSDIGTAAKGTLTTSTIDPVAGRVMRNADWGFGGANGVAADQNILNNTVNGIYRSGSSETGKPDGTNSGSSYLKFGWGSTYYGLLYNSPNTDKWYVRTVSNGTANSWKELMTVGLFGIGSTGASNAADLWPTSTIDEAGVPSGSYWLSSAIGGRPPAIGNNNSVMWHRQAGSAGGQLIVSSDNRLIWRGRHVNSHQPFREALAIGEYGFGGNTVNPPNGRDGVNPLGWYYRSSPTPSWGGGSFFLDMPYSTSMNAGLRISTDPYTDNFYMNGAVSGQKTYRDACKLVHDKNIVGDVAAGSVIATGSNANGTWVRFADGTQICWSPTMNSNWVDTQAGGMYTGSEIYWRFPMTFASSIPYVVHADTTGTDNILWASCGPSRSYSGVGLKVSSPIRWNQSFHMRAVAIGRWKA